MPMSGYAVVQTDLLTCDMLRQDLGISHTDVRKTGGYLFNNQKHGNVPGSQAGKIGAEALGMCTSHT
jgi:hypothetical protein